MQMIYDVAMRVLIPRICFTLIVLGFASYLLLSCNVDLSIYDEATSLYGAVRVMDGELPYRDFWMVYPPGIFYTLAGLFSLFGVSVMVERIFYVVVHLLIALQLYYLTARLATRWAALSSVSRGRGTSRVRLAFRVADVYVTVTAPVPDVKLAQ